MHRPHDSSKYGLVARYNLYQHLMTRMCSGQRSWVYYYEKLDIDHASQGEILEKFADEVENRFQISRY